MLGQTLDDAAGEAIDKGARLLGLPFPGGPHLERLAAEGDPDAFAFPAPRTSAGLDFSFAGLKTALLYKVRDLGEDEAHARRAPTSPPPTSTRSSSSSRVRVARALEQTGLDRLAIGGGVAANGPLRERLGALAPTVKIPPRALCTDNAAMIASAARYAEPVAFPGYLGSKRTRPASAPCERAMAVVDLYGRPGCHLCDDARAVLAPLSAELGLRAARARHRGRRRPPRRYLERIPVVVLDGERPLRLLRRRGRPAGSPR